MIFQDPMLALNPVKTIGWQLNEDVLLHNDISKKQARDRSLEALKEVEIQRAESRIGNVACACRLDRLEELADGTLALIDYKSGARRTKSPWLDERLASTQLPLYALDVGSRLAALLTIELGSEPIAYRGAARQPSLVADSLRAIPDAESWAAMVERWRAQIRGLVEDYVAGDVRLYAEDWGDAAGEWAPLTRVYAHILRAPRADP